MSGEFTNPKAKRGLSKKVCSKFPGRVKAVYSVGYIHKMKYPFTDKRKHTKIKQTMQSDSLNRTS